jgi:hypothetical protein
MQLDGVRVSLALLCTSVAFGLAAWIAVPTETAVLLPASFQVAIEFPQDSSLLNASITVARSKRASASSKLMLGADFLSATNPNGRSLEFQVQGSPGVRFRCISVRECGGVGSSETATRSRFRRLKSYGIWVASATLDVTTPKFAFDQNGADVQVAVPSFQSSAPLVTPGEAFGITSPIANFGYRPPVSVRYIVPGGPYDLTSGPLPTSSNSSIIWNQYPDQMSEVLQGTGENNHTIQDNTNWLFLAGVFAGVAGAAFVGAITEFVRESRTRRQGRFPRPLDGYIV